MTVIMTKKKEKEIMNTTKKDNYEWCYLIPFGWEQLARKMIQECEAIDSSYEIIDMKEKWGCLSVYSSCETERYIEIEEIEEKYRKMSKKTCSKCGRIATRMSQGYILPFCDKCWSNNDFKSVS